MEPQDESISEKSQQELQEQGVPKSDDDKKLSEKVGRRMRSRQKS
ncbi:hypothetical protein CK203_093587 [Vitis vinifera]|uniref:Uncharacterized protein n=1 Tax=Vitis vinifera TaxID=29760 RepID=A0A438C4R0_VITVI|nr:hypothetical protein CK203_093587 [Vitis vinifera]